MYFVLREIGIPCVHKRLHHSLNSKHHQSFNEILKQIFITMKKLKKKKTVKKNPNFECKYFGQFLSHRNEKFCVKFVRMAFRDINVNDYRVYGF